MKIVKLKAFGVQYVLKLYGGSNPARERVIFRRQSEEVACIPQPVQQCFVAGDQGGEYMPSMDSTTFPAEMAKLMAASCRFSLRSRAQQESEWKRKGELWEKENPSEDGQGGGWAPLGRLQRRRKRK